MSAVAPTHPDRAGNQEVLAILARCGNVDLSRLSHAIGPVDGEDALRALVALQMLDRIAARAVSLVLKGRLSEGDLKQLLDVSTLQYRLDRFAPAPAPPTVHPLPLPLNSRLGRYPVLGLLGRGGSCHVYRSVHPELGVPVALKVSADATPLEAEAGVLARISHANVVRLWDLERVGRLTVLVLEYVDGESLARTLGRVGAVDVRVAFRMARDVIRGLCSAHAAGVVHGDVKPANVIATSAGRFKLADFGSTRPTSLALYAGGAVHGTWPYAALECFDGRGNERSDIYSLGLTLYHALTGHSPVTARGFAECREEHTNLTLDPLHWTVPGVSRKASDLIRRMTALDPTDRPTGRRLVAEARRAFCPDASATYSHPEIAR
ncbi:MAG: hypothetical protein C0467_15635 [Planctomycetaceae bacterium]|nr:hypothetical protein [Planctomycetaceae bacterium]